jgi:peroxiredoxin
VPDSSTGLPAPVDDGAAARLVGVPLPAVRLPSTAGGTVDLALRSPDRRSVVFAYPRTSRPGVASPTGWDEIPGARGCTPQACAFRDLAVEFTAAGAEVFGLSTQDTGYQSEAAQRLELSYPLLSDRDLALTRALELPTFVVDGAVLLRRLTMIVFAGRIERVLYPVSRPDAAAADALAALRRGPLSAS